MVKRDSVRECFTLGLSKQQCQEKTGASINYIERCYNDMAIEVHRNMFKPGFVREMQIRSLEAELFACIEDELTDKSPELKNRIDMLAFKYSAISLTNN